MPSPPVLGEATNFVHLRTLNPSASFEHESLAFEINAHGERCSGNSSAGMAPPCDFCLNHVVVFVLTKIKSFFDFSKIIFNLIHFFSARHQPFNIRRVCPPRGKTRFVFGPLGTIVFHSLC